MTASRPVPRYARASEAKAVAALAERLFFETFAANNTPQNMRAYADVHFTGDVLSELIDSRQHGVIVLDAGGEFAGVGVVRADNGDALALEIQRFYLGAAWQGTGLARDLMQAVTDHALAIGTQSLWLGVWEHNPRAIRFYEKHGFRVTGEHEFRLGDDLQRDLVMSYTLDAPLHDDDSFVAAFRDARWPPAAWTHAAHVRLAWTLVGERGLAGALDTVRRAIRRYNGEVLERSHAYHDTMTQAFVWLVAAARRPGESFAAFCAREPALLSPRPLAVFAHYSRERLHADAARTGFVEPDLEPLPVVDGFDGPSALDAGLQETTHGVV